MEPKKILSKYHRDIAFGGGLIALSAVLHGLHYAIYRDFHHISIYFLGDLAFMPISVFLVTMILEKILERREKETLLNKLNMVIGTFFSEVGKDLLSALADFDSKKETLSIEFSKPGSWTPGDFTDLINRYKTYDTNLKIDAGAFAPLRELLVSKRPFLLRLLENQTLLEHQSFTQMLWAVFHFTEELESRLRLSGLPDTDYKHLANDAKRAYLALITEWLRYMNYLCQEYPYLFSFAVRTNPFDKEVSVTVVS